MNEQSKYQAVKGEYTAGTGALIGGYQLQDLTISERLDERIKRLQEELDTLLKLRQNPETFLTLSRQVLYTFL